MAVDVSGMAATAVCRNHVLSHNSSKFHGKQEASTHKQKHIPYEHHDIFFHDK